MGAATGRLLLIPAGPTPPHTRASHQLRIRLHFWPQGWREGAITFPPTFKFKVGTNMYLGDTPSTAVLGGGGTGAEDDLDDEYEDVGAGAGGAEAEKQKKRTPAWCDRVLFTPGGALSQGAYVRGETTASDHKPVASRLALRTARYDRKKIDALLHACRQQADMQQAAQRPRPSLEPNLVSIGAIKYGQVRSFRVTLSNSGPIEGLYHFVPPPSAAFGDDETPGLPAWVMAVPEEGYVPAGGSCEIELRVCVEGGARGAASALARSADDCLDAIVILRCAEHAVGAVLPRDVTRIMSSCAHRHMHSPMSHVRISLCWRFCASTLASRHAQPLRCAAQLSPACSRNPA